MTCCYLSRAVQHRPPFVARRARRTNTRYNVQAQAETRDWRGCTLSIACSSENRLIDCLGVQRAAALMATSAGAQGQSIPQWTCRRTAFRFRNGTAAGSSCASGDQQATDPTATAGSLRVTRTGCELMPWLDAEQSREIDPVLDCLTYLARQRPGRHRRFPARGSCTQY